ncbi:hypothetical protein D3C80_2135460 [compost metagenome]
MIPEAEAVYPAVALSHSKEGLAVVAFHTGYYVEFAVQFNRTRIEHTVHTDSLGEIWIGLRIKIITPE